MHCAVQKHIQNKIFVAITDTGAYFINNNPVAAIVSRSAARIQKSPCCSAAVLASLHIPAAQRLTCADGERSNAPDGGADGVPPIDISVSAAKPTASLSASSEQ